MRFWVQLFLEKKILGIPCLPTSLAFGFVLGAFATFAEPAIGVLRAAGSGVDPTAAPLLWTILNTGAGLLVNCVGVGVGIAVLLGVLRFYKGWSLKPFIYAGVIILSCLTLYMQFSDDRLKHVLGLAWDCGAVTTGPVTVPLVLALGIGVCRIVSTGGSSNTGFGVVTLASLFPILAVICYALYLFNTDNYYYASQSNAEWHKQAGEYGKNYPKDLQKFGDLKAQANLEASQGIDESELSWSLSPDETVMVENYLNENKRLPEGYTLKTKVTEGEISASKLSSGERENVEVKGAKTYVVREGFKAPDGVWNPDSEIATAFSNNLDFFPNTFRPQEVDKNENGKVDPGEDFYSIEPDGSINYSKTDGKLTGPDQDRGALEGAIWAIVPLCSILLLVLIGGLRQRPKHLDELFIGITCAVVGMCLFNLGIALGLTPLGEQLGGNVVSSFASIQPWQSEGFVEPLFKSSTAGKCLAILFGFLLGYGATLAEPALNALGSTVEKITVGAFKKKFINASCCNRCCFGDRDWSCENSFQLGIMVFIDPLCYAVNSYIYFERRFC